MSIGAPRSGTKRLDASTTIEELQAQLEEERQARQRVAEEAALQRRLVQELERLFALLRGGADAEELLQQLLRVFVDNARAERGLICLRDGEKLRLRALYPEQPI